MAEAKKKEEAVAVAVETPEVKEEPKKVRKPREKVRSIDEIIDLAPSKLTDKEKDSLIKHFKEENTLLTNKMESYKQNASAAFEQTRQLEDQYKAMENFYRGRLQYVDNQLNAFHAAINEAIKGGIA